MDKRYYIGFNLVKGIGAIRLRALIDYFGDVETAWKAPLHAFREIGLSSKVIETIAQVRSTADLDLIYRQLEDREITVLTWEDEEYPRLLKEIDQPPPVLYLRGKLLPEDEWAVAIVGTRRVTPYGRQVADSISATLAQNGITVISGLALGVDTIAHQAALNVGGRTLAVMGCGVDRIYPPENRKLAENLISNGALISDYPMGTPPEAVNFPPRNRIISGLSLAVIIVEAGERSGALITAGFAADQGRDVFAVPGNITALQSKGTNRLIRDGARPLLEPGDVLEALNLTRVHEHQSARQVLQADATETQLLAVLSQDPVHVDDIRNQVDLPIERVTATLTLMELKGMVRQVGNMHYVCAREEQAAYQEGEVD